jgi:8-oxo-dGTP pyrophosphatase MutT (NUDIX family)
MSSRSNRPADFDPQAVPVRPAATVMLVRDSPEGVEVFMMRRTLNAVFAGGLYVFPGGAVDAADRAEEVATWCDGRTDADASERLQLGDGGLGFWIAAIRECFEEAGVLLARPAGGADAVRFDDPHVAARFNDARHAVHDGTLRLVDLCEREGLRLTAGDIHYVSHWITPVGEPRRFDTRFFVARAPQAQEPLHDDGETIDSFWIRPRDALARADAGELAMLPPTISNLEFLAPHTTADEALAAAAEVGTPPTILPELHVDEHGKVTIVVKEA